MVARVHMPPRFRAYRTALRAHRGRAKVRCFKQIVRHESKLLIQWWRLNDRRYRWRWRAANGVFALLIILGIALPVLQQLLLNNRYHLSADAIQLVGATDPKLQDQLKYTDGSYEFNQAAVQQSGPMRVQAGASTGEGNDTSTYALSVPQDFSKGTTYTDVNTSQSFQLVPQFSGNPVKEVQGHLVIPVDGAQAIYTLKGNGLKEDIVVPVATQDAMSFSYTLQLPKTLEAKVIPDSGGNIGIYSADPTLYGNVSASDSKDQALLQKARENGAKTNLVFGIPSPTIKTVSGQLPAGTSARFELQGNTLTVVATGLTAIHGAFTIDPSVVVTSASDFQTGGNNEGMIAFDSTNNQISRDSLTGGSVASGTTSGTAPAIASTGAESSGTGTSTTVAVPSGVANGSLVVAHVWVVWESATTPTDSYMSVPTGWSLGYSSVVGSSGGYIYMAWYYHWATGSESTAYKFTATGDTGEIGGIHGEDARITGASVSSGNPFSDSPHANYSTTGSTVVSSFTPSANYALLLAGVGNFDSNNNWTPPSGWTNNNYTYDSALMSATQSVSAATGSLTFGNGGGGYIWASVITIAGTTTTSGGWSNTSSTQIARRGAGVATYNGYLYAVEGNNNTVEYAPLNSNGTVGTWQYTTSVTANSADHFIATVAYNGYLYAAGGCDINWTTCAGELYYAPIHSDGTLGTWQVQDTLEGEAGFGMVAYNGYMYVADSGASSTTVEYAPIHANGSVGDWATTNAFSGNRDETPIVAYNGYLYAIGGHDTYSGDTTVSADVSYAPIKADGSLGTWNETNNLPAGQIWANATAYDGYLYAFGGYPGSDGGTTTTAVTYAQINANGTIGSWQTTVSLGTAVAESQGVAYNGYLYAVDGDTGNNTATSTVQYAKISPAGTTSNASSVTSSFTTSRERHAAVAYNGCLFILGGYGGSGNTYVNYAQYAPIDSTGDVTTSWVGKNFTNARADLAAVAYNGYLYVIGGYNGNTGTYYNDVQYAPITPGTCAIGTWSTTTSFDTTANARGGIDAAVYNGYMYVAGGINASGNFSAVRYAPINSDGTVGTWAATTSLSTATNRLRLLTYGGYIYEMGGTQLALPNVNNGNTTGSRPVGSGYTTVRYAPINTNGTIGSWTSTTGLPYQTYEFGATIVNGYVYVAGGFTTASTSGTSSSMNFAPINADGSLGTWQHTEQVLASTAGSLVLVTDKGRLYDLGGRANTGTDNTGRLGTHVMNINNGGTGAAQGVWSNEGGLNTTHSYGATVVYNGYVYMVGGDSTSLEYAPLNADGSTGTWTQDTSHVLSTEHDYAGVVAYNGYMYLLGGMNISSSTYYKNIQYAPISATGGLSGNWASAGGNVSNGGAGANLVAYHGYLYSIGGWDGSTDWNTVQYAAINSDGTIGSWQTTSSFDAGRSDGVSLAYDGYMYLVGGNGTADYNTVQYAAINSNGTLGTWNYTSSFATPRTDMTMGAYNGYIYLVGGVGTNCTGSTTDGGQCGDTQYAAINSNGTLGQWQQALATVSPDGNSMVPTGERGPSAQTIYNGYMYGVGGSMYGSTNGQLAMGLSLNSIARVGHYSKSISLGTATNITSITYNGTVPGGNSAVTYQLAGADGVFGSAATTASVAGSGGCYGNAVGAYYVRINVTLDDSYGAGTSGVFPDGTGNADLTDFTINYNPIHPAPNIRLRLGQTLQSGDLSPFDTCIDGESSGEGGGGGDDSSPAAPTVAWSGMTHDGGTTPSLTVPASTVQAGDIVVVYMMTEDNAESLQTPTGSGTWTSIAQGSQTFWHYGVWQSSALTSAQATAINGQAIAGSSDHDSWAETIAVVRGASGTLDPVAASGSSAYASSAPSTIPVSSMTPSGANRLALVFVDEGSDAVIPSSDPSLSGWTTVQAAHGYGGNEFGDTAHAIALFSAPISAATGTLNVATSWPSWSGDGGYGWVSVGFAPSL